MTQTPSELTKGTIGFLTSTFTSKLSREIWAGIVDTANDQGYNAICFCGALLYPEEREFEYRSANIIYDLVTKKNIDGLIIYGGDLGQYLPYEGLLSFYNRYKDFPLVSIALELPGIPSVTVDNYAGMHELTTHCIKYHGYTSFAFITGPEGHEEARVRTKAFMDALSENNVTIDSENIFPGDFTVDCGYQTIRKLDKKLPDTIDIIMASDDDSAIGAYKELIKRGMTVPEDIALTGFDDSTMAHAQFSALTTIKQPLYTEGQRASELCIRQIAGLPVDMQNVIPTEVIYRQSCGCSNILSRHLNMSVEKEFSFPARSTLQDHTTDLLKRFQSTNSDTNSALSTREIQQLVRSFLKSLDTSRDAYFLDELQRVVHSFFDEEREMSAIHTFFTSLRQYVNAYLSLTDYMFVDNLFHRSALLMEQISSRVSYQKYFNALEQMTALGLITNMLNVSFDFNKMKSVMQEISSDQLEPLDIRSFILCLYKDSAQPLKESTLLCGTSDSSMRYDALKNPDFQTLELFPEEIAPLLRSKNLIINALYFSEEQFGFTVVEIDPWNAHLCDILSWQISSAIKRLYLLQDLKHQTDQLEISLKTLKQTQRQLVEAEKMACLGSLVAGVAHEINTPLGAGITCSSYLSDTIASFSDSFNDHPIKKSDFIKFINDTSEASKGLLDNLQHAAQLVQSFKNIAVDQLSLIKKRFNLREYLLEIIAGHHEKLTKSGATLHFTCSETLDIDSYPAAFFQLFSILFMNSLIHGFEDNQQGTIVIDIQTVGPSIQIQYSDNGQGIKPEIMEHIFEPFNTTKRTQGCSGLGLHVAYNLVTQKLCGTICCSSAPAGGTLFTIIIPTAID